MPSSGLAQTSQKVTDGSTPSALTAGAPAGSYSLSGFETVNPFNGGLNFSLPLLSVGGRGDAGYGITMRIDNKWLIRKDINPGQPASFYPTPTWTNESWALVKLDFGVGRLSGRYGITRDNTYTLARLTFTAPDGTEYEMRDVQTNGTPQYTGWTNCVYGNYYNRGRVFVTADGASATFIADPGHDVKDLCGYDMGDIAPPGYVILKNGTRFRIENGGSIAWMRDRNGNLVNFAYNYNSQGQKVTTVTDSLGRVVTVTEGSPVTISYKGFGDADRSVKVHTTLLGSALRSGYVIRTQNSLFPGINNPVGNSQSNPLVISRVELPDGRFYVFRYNDYGELARVELPTGGAFEYDYAPGLTDGPESGMLTDANNQKQVYRRVVERRVYPEGGSGSAYAVKQVYSRPESSVTNAGYVDVVQCTSGPATGQCNTGTPLLSSVRHFYHGSPRLSFNKRPIDFTGWLEGKEYETHVFDPQSGALLRKVVNTWEQPIEGSTWPLQPGVSEANGGVKPNNPQVTQTVTTLGDTNQVSRRTFSYDQYGNLTDTYEYDYGAGAAGAFLRRTHTDYVAAAAYVNADANPALGAGIRGLPLQQWVSSDAAGNSKLSLTTYAYDQFAPEDCPLIVGHDPAYGAAFNTRGNLTGETQYANASAGTGAVSAASRFDIAGNVVSETDANGHTSYVSYADSFSDGNNGRRTYAYATATTSAAPNPTPVPNPDGGATFGAGTFGLTSALTTSTIYDFRTGLVTQATDANSKTTTYDYSDPFNRLKLATRPDGGTTSYHYDRYNNAGLMRDYVRTMTALDSSRFVTSYQYFDGLGRASRSFLHEGGSPDLFLTTDTQYDALGRVWRVSNPHRTTGSDQPVNPPGLWTTTDYDALGRVGAVTTPDGAKLYTLYDGSRTLVTDQAGKQRIGKTDALGRLTEVWEVRSPDGATGTESASFPIPPGLASVIPAVSAGYRTSYTYDATGNLRKAEQGGQQRFFMYDSLSRLTRARNPEQAVNGSLAVTDPVTGNGQWTFAYGYDPEGNLTSRTDARGVTTSYAYDHLNRNILTSYVNGSPDTPTVLRRYDFGVNGKGLPYLTQQSGSVTSATHFDEYDVVGRVLVMRQKFETNGAWSADYRVSRAYDLAGNVRTQTYPSGRVVAYSYDVAGRVGDNGSQLAFTGNLGDGVQRTYAAGVTYSEFGGVQQEWFGTAMPLYHKLHYNRRGQLFDIRLSTVPWATDQWNWNRGAIVNYFSGNYAWEGDPNTPPAADNNGNLRRQQHWFPGDDSYNGYVYTQDTFEYDALNRLAWVSEAHGGAWGQSGQVFRQTYRYDRWGNRTVDLGQSPGVTVPQYDFERGDLPSTNRLYAPGDLALPMEQRRMRYDAAGSLTHDGYTGAGGRVYDAENRMTAAQDSSGNWAYYTYDADGQRARRKVANEETWQVYGVGGELLAEYPAGAAPFLASKEYGYRGGELLVTMSSGDTDRLRRFVKSLYYNCLARDPSPSELAAKMDQLALAGVQGGETQLLSTARSIARSLFESTEYVARNRTTGQYVSDLYNAYLQRGPDASGLNHWVNHTNAYGRGATLNAFEVCTEFATLAATVYGTAAGGEDQRVDTFVRNFYYGAFQREPTAAEAQQQRQRLNNAASASRDQVIAEAQALGVELIQSTNYNAGHTVEQYVTDLYQAFLQRAPDGPGLNHWVNHTNTHGRAATLDAFRVATEYRELAGTLYRETFWLVSDHLGTPRMLAGRTGSLAGVKRHDYLPFGEELYAGAGGRALTQGYNALDNVRQKFTKKERDAETGLDYFLARYYSSAHGRFVNPDEFSGGPDELYNFVTDASANPTLYADLSRPQSLNKYQYAYNNPLRYIDPDGHQPQTGQCPVPVSELVARQVEAQIQEGIEQLKNALEKAKVKEEREKQKEQLWRDYQFYTVIIKTLPKPEMAKKGASKNDQNRRKADERRDDSERPPKQGQRRSKQDRKKDRSFEGTQDQILDINEAQKNSKKTKRPIDSTKKSEQDATTPLKRIKKSEDVPNNSNNNQP